MSVMRGYGMPAVLLDLCSFGVLSGVMSLRSSIQCSLHVVGQSLV
jgi:hypothetical protein